MLYLAQHGLAVSERIDPDRPLSDEGRKNSEKVSHFLNGKDISVDSVWHSKKKRSSQTAQIFAESVTCKEKIERDDINPNDPVEMIKEEIESSGKDIFIVGHLPFLEKLSSLLLTGCQDNRIIRFINSAVTCLEYKDQWQIVWEITPSLLQGE